MRIRSFRVPFSKIVAEDAHELEFGPDDYVVVRPLFGLSASEVVDLTERMAVIGELNDPDAATPVEDKAAHAASIKARATEAQTLSDQLVLDILKTAVLEWSLKDADGVSIPLPKTGKALRALPGALASGLYPFLMDYRGDAPNPTTRS